MEKTTAIRGIVLVRTPIRYTKHHCYNCSRFNVYEDEDGLKGSCSFYASELQVDEEASFEENYFFLRCRGCLLEHDYIANKKLADVVPPNQEEL